VRILLKDGQDKEWKSVDSTTYSAEADLRGLIAKGPSIIPVDEIREGMPPFVMAVREYGLPGSGNTDVMLFNVEGDIALVECKLASNAEIKRKVIGQIFKYAAYLWNTSYESLDEAIMRRTGKSLAINIQDHKLPTGWEEESFRMAVSQTLKSGTFHLIIAVDRMNEELSRTINYLNECGNAAYSFHALELHKYRSGNTEMLVPQLHGQIPQTKQEDDVRTKIWTEVGFLENLQSGVPEETYIKINGLHTWSKLNADRVSYGRGRTKGSFTYHYVWEGHTVSVFSVYSDGMMSINHGYLTKQLERSEVEAFHEKLKKLKSFSNLEYREAGFPTVRVADISTQDVEAFEKLLIGSFEKYSAKHQLNQ
jgi:hypothetical protein